MDHRAPRRPLFEASLMALLLLCACDGGGGGGGGEDAGARPDAGEPDGGSAEDAGPIDAGPDALRPSYPLEARFPEGGTYDPEGRAFYVGSLGDGSVRRVDADTGEETVVFEESAEGVWWTLGMDIDPARRALVVCAMEDRRAIEESDIPYDGYVWVIDLESGERTATYDLSLAAPDATCTDLTVAADGSIYVCDREQPNLYRVDPEGTLSLFATDEALGSGFVGQNALVVLPDQSALLSLIYLPSRLVRVSLPEGAVTEVTIDGDFSDGTPALSGADGMTLTDEGLLVAFTSQLNLLQPTLADWSAASSSTVDVPAGMTDVIHTPHGDYLLNGQAVTFALGGEPEPSALTRFDGRLAP